MNDKTVLISGVGICGPTLAFWLKAAGLKPTLIEHPPALRTGGYVIDFWGLGYDIAERMGLAGDIDRIGYHMREMRIVDDLGGRVTGFGTSLDLYSFLPQDRRAWFSWVCQKIEQGSKGRNWADDR